MFNRKGRLTGVPKGVVLSLITHPALPSALSTLHMGKFRDERHVIERAGLRIDIVTMLRLGNDHPFLGLCHITKDNSMDTIIPHASIVISLDLVAIPTLLDI